MKLLTIIMFFMWAIPLAVLALGGILHMIDERREYGNSDLSDDGDTGN